MTDFNLDEELKNLNQPDWVVKAFVNRMDLTKVKSKADLDKEFKKYMELKK